MAKPKRLGNKKYMIVYDVPPRNRKARQQKREILSGVTKVEAEAALAKRVERAKIFGLTDDSGMTMSELFDKFMAVKKNRLEATSIDRYESLISTYLRPELGTIPVASLRKANLLEAYEKWQARARRPSGRTIHHAHDLLRATLNWAVSVDYAETNVARKVTAEDLPKALKPENVVLNEAELRTLLAEAQQPSRRAVKRGTLSSQPWFYPAVAFAAYTGTRRGEVLAVKWSDLDLEAGTVTIRESLSEPRSGLAFKRPKNGRVRTLTIGTELAAILQTHKAKQAEEQLLLGEAYDKGDLAFARPDGTPVTPWNFGAAFKDLVERAGVTPITLHDLRDTHASLLAKAGVPIEVISNRLRHSCISITVDRYLTVYQERDAAAAAAFERLVA
ncbi:MAG: tyrosine-type recombinase/integrase [Candidatus Cybelea sp.]